MKTALLVFSWSIAGCFNPELPSGIRCGPEGGCPPGQLCHTDGVCYHKGDLPIADGPATDSAALRDGEASDPLDSSMARPGLWVEYMTPNAVEAQSLELWQRLVEEVSGKWQKISCSASTAPSLSCNPLIPGEVVIELYVRYYHSAGGRPRGSCENGKENGGLLVAWWGDPLDHEIFPGDPALGIDCVHRYRVPPKPSADDGGPMSSDDMMAAYTDAAPDALDSTTIELRGGGCQCAILARGHNQKSTFPSWAVLGATVTRLRRQRPARQSPRAAGVFLLRILQKFSKRIWPRTEWWEFVRDEHRVRRALSFAWKCV